MAVTQGHRTGPNCVPWIKDCNSMSPFSNDWGEARNRTAGKVPALGGEDTCAVDYTLGCQPQSVAQRRAEIPRHPQCHTRPSVNPCALCGGPAPPAARSPSQHGPVACSRGLAKTSNRMVISAHQSTLKWYSSLLRTGVFSHSLISTSPGGRRLWPEASNYVTLDKLLNLPEPQCPPLEGEILMCH